MGPQPLLQAGLGFAVGALTRGLRRGRQLRGLRHATVSANTEVVRSLQPAQLFGHFAEISSIPRPSRKEAAILRYIKDFAEARGLAWREDATGNLLVIRPGSGGGEAAEPVMLQGHVDMVCEKNADTPHDFDADPIRLRVDCEWLRATGTTLGADNGVGVAAALAVLEQGPDATLPPIEALFTVDEETGLTGAFGLDGSMVTATRLLNLDTEEFGSVYIGCAGGGNSTLHIEASPSEVDGDVATLALQVRGLLGGHSGINIHEGRGNAVMMAAALAADVLAAIPEARLTAIEGGDKHNAIPREARAVVVVPSDSGDRVRATVAQRGEALRTEFGLLEKSLTVAVEAAASSPGSVARAFSRADSARIVSTMRVLPHGVVKMSHAMEGLVETSNNVASAHTSDSGVLITMSTRSSIGSALEDLRDRLQTVAELASGSFERGPAYPGWAPVPSSPLVNLTLDKLAARSGAKPKVLAIHAGLECGLLLEKCPSISEAVSFGPTITGAHSPDEALEISTVQPFFQALMDILGDLATGKPRSRL